MLERATASGMAWPVFVVDPALTETHRDAPRRRAWFDLSVRALDERLRARGSGLTLLRGSPSDVLPRFAASIGAERVVAAADEDPVAVQRDARVGEAVDLELVQDQRIVAAEAIRTADGGSYSVFTPFRRALEREVASASDPHLARAEVDPSRLAPPGADAVMLPDGEHDHLPVPGEGAAAERLGAFARTDLLGYREDRDRPDLDATSRLSPHLRVGSLSIRACWRAVLDATERARISGRSEMVKSAAAWKGELAWREFFAHVLAANPRLTRESYRREYDGLEWERGATSDELLDAWREGRTGYPLVDAGMRQLAATGWMHNRARLVTASFLVKHLGLDWRRGEQVFSDRLLDADVQQNNGNWQWVAGVGTDAAPYFRIFNPTLQARRFDPDGTYVRRWVPELTAVPDDLVHEPWRAGKAASAYPSPIIDLRQARERALARYAAARERFVQG